MNAMRFVSLVLKYLQIVVVDLAAGAFEDANVSPEVAIAPVVTSHGVVAGAVEEDPGAVVVLHEVVFHHGTAGRRGWPQGE